MRNLIEFLQRYNHWFVFLLLEVVSFVLLFQYNGYQGSVWFTSANAVTGKLYEVDSWVGAFFNQSSNNADLTRRNLELEQEVSRLRQWVAVLNEHQDSTNASAKVMNMLKPYKLIDAKVISNSVSKPNNMITIDKGKADGVKPDMGVACGTGVVGIVFQVGEHFSTVLPVLNERSNISCAIRGRGYFGYLHWNGGRSDVAYVDDIPRHAKFEDGDTIETSGYSAVFPPGIMVGVVTHTHDSKDGLSYRLEVALSTDYSRLREVCVIDNALMKDRIDEMRQERDTVGGKKATPIKTESSKPNAEPKKSSSEPKKTSSEPKKSSSEPKKTSSEPKKSSSEPKKTSSEPKKSSSEPKKTSSEQKKSSDSKPKETKKPAETKKTSEKKPDKK